jgi:predicted  nucleic acid-binding Zn-ribbon protein
MHMSWFRNHYTCARCGASWQDEWSAMCEDDCAECGARHMSPEESENLTQVIEKEGEEYVVLWSPETAEHEPRYCQLGRFASRREAEAFSGT